MIMSRLTLKSVGDLYAGVLAQCEWMLFPGEEFVFGRNLVGQTSFGFCIRDEQGRHRQVRTFHSLQEAYDYAQGMRFVLSEQGHG